MEGLELTQEWDKTLPTTERGYHERSLDSNGGSAVTSRAPCTSTSTTTSTSSPWDVIEEFLGRHLA